MSNSNPGPFVDVNGTVFFVANDGLVGAELWKSDGTAAGTQLVKDINPIGTTGSSISQMIAHDGLLFFSANDGINGAELWKSDGTELGTVMVKNINELAGSGSSISSMTASNGTLYFSASNGVNGAELWRTDGTPEGTVMVQDLNAGSASASLLYLVDFNGTLFFRADTAATGLELFKLGDDGLPVLVKETMPGSADGWVLLLTVVQDKLFFIADDPTSWEELWVSDGTTEGTQKLLDINGLFGTGSASSSIDTASPMLAVGDKLFFRANDNNGSAGNGRELWVSDGTAAGTRMVKDILPGNAFAPSTSPDSFVAMGGALYFRATDGLGGFELWKTDGTEAGTVRVRDLNPGSGHGLATANLITALDIEQQLVFTANDGSSGIELWSSDGTLAGTELVADLAPGADNGAPTLVRRAGSFGFFSANDTVNGRELWAVPVTRDTTPPTLACPANLTAEATSGAGARVFYPLPAVSDDVMSPPPQVRYSIPRGQLFPFGDTSVSITVRDAAGNGAIPCAFTVTVADTAAPTLVCPADQLAEAEDGTGAAVSYPAATASDAVTPSSGITITYDLASGSRFAFGDTTVNVTAKDAADNTASCQFKVTVSDTTGPTLSCPARVTVEASDASGATASYPPATASDNVSAVSVTYSKASGTLFALGETLVTATATDAASNSSTCGFVVDVVDTTAPALTCPTARTVEATSASGASVSYDPAAATDSVSAATITYSQASDSVFALGLTEVTVTATDAAGNAATCTLPIRVEDTTAPSVTCPTVADVEATSSSGATVSFADATASDAVTASPTLGYTQQSGSTFAIGSTPVVATATDGAGNAATCSFTVRVVDTTRPAVSCPSAQSFEATSSAGAVVGYVGATATDGASTPTLSYSKDSGTAFALGTTQVVATATDGAGNTATCNFDVVVADTTAPAVTCPSDRTAEAASASGATVSYSAATATDAVSTPSIQYSAATGSLFALGLTTVTVTATDLAGNVGSCAFSVTIADTTAPTITCPAAHSAEATSSSGAMVTFDAATATDSVSTATITYSAARGSTFALGQTMVTATATDDSGNSSTCSFAVTIADTTAPTITCPSSISREASGASGAVVTWAQATATDLVSTPSLTYSHPSGHTFAIGNTDVAVTATDDAGNSANCGFLVTVVDTVAPTVTCPADIALKTSSEAGAAAEFSATATDVVSATPTLTFDHESGSIFAIGETLVTVTATDAKGNAGTCTFSVSVEKEAVVAPPPEGKTGCGCASTEGGGSALWLFAFAAALGLIGTRRRLG